MRLILAVDIGGTHIRAAVYPHDQIQPIRHRRTTTLNPGETTYQRLTSLVDSLWTKDVAIISVASAGPLDPEAGLILSAPNIPGWTNFPLEAELTQKYRVPVCLGNDANLAALGEWRFGAGQGHHDLLYLTISTGIGGGVISRDQLLLGQRGMAAELGHITVMEGGPVCPCGKQGHLEALASGPAIVHYIRECLQAGETSSLGFRSDLTARTAAKAAQYGDPLAIRAFARAGDYLGRALADYLHIFNPSIVIFGGGVSLSGELLFAPMRASLSSHVMEPVYMENLVITTAQLGDDAGLLGALALAQTRLVST